LNLSSTCSRDKALSITKEVKNVGLEIIFANQ
jgi:hypothetical protein